MVKKKTYIQRVRHTRIICNDDLPVSDYEVQQQRKQTKREAEQPIPKRITRPDPKDSASHIAAHEHCRISKTESATSRCDIDGSNALHHVPTEYMQRSNVAKTAVAV